MKVKLQSIRNNGDLTRERAILNVLADDDIGHYLLLDTTYNGNSVSNLVQHPFWFPDGKVNQGDLVEIYTKDGINKIVRNPSGHLTHFIYRGLDKTIWNKEGDCAVLMDINEWTAKPVRVNEQ
jgi:hypothetical protein